MSQFQPTLSLSSCFPNVHCSAIFASFCWSSKWLLLKLFHINFLSHPSEVCTFIGSVQEDTNRPLPSTEHQPTENYLTKILLEVLNCHAASWPVAPHHLTTPAVQSTLSARQLLTFFPERNEGMSGHESRNKMWSSVMTALRNWSVVGGSAWRMVVMRWRGEYRW